MIGLARGFRWRRMLEEGRYGAISVLAKAEGVERGYAGFLLRLTLPWPQMDEAAVARRQPKGAMPPILMEGVRWGGRYCRVALERQERSGPGRSFCRSRVHREW
jgi:hypothetical protein